MPPYNSLPSDKAFAEGLAKGDDSTWGLFLDQYIPIIYTWTSRFTGVSDTEVLDTLTVNIFVTLWENRDIFTRDERQGLIIYRMLLQQIFSYLQEQHNSDRIRALRKLQPIHPACCPLIQAPKGKWLLCHFRYPFLHKISRIWKTC